MAWRLHLTNQTIKRVDLLAGQTALLVAWPGRERAAFFDLETGYEAGELLYKVPAVDSRQTPKWQEFAAGLVASNGAALPFARAGSTTIYTTEDGRMRLYHTGGADLFLETGGKEVKLETGTADFVAIGLDRFLGLVAALDEEGQLAIYQQHIRVGRFNMDLKLDAEAVPGVAVSHGGSAIFVTDGQQVVLVDAGGRVRKRLSTHYVIGRIACSPNGKLLLTSDAETGVLRVYSGTDLTPTHQRHALDLIAEATQVQLMADMPPGLAAVGALAVNNKGTIAFTVTGVVCVTDLEKLIALPRPQPLL